DPDAIVSVDSDCRRPLRPGDLARHLPVGAPLVSSPPAHHGLRRGVGKAPPDLVVVRKGSYRMLESFTASALRALEGAQVRARRRGASAVEPHDLLAALADESESRAGVLLADFGLDTPKLLAALGVSVRLAEEEDFGAATGGDPLPQSSTLRAA